MQRIYTIALATAVAMSAMAVTPRVGVAPSQRVSAEMLSLAKAQRQQTAIAENFAAAQSTLRGEKQSAPKYRVPEGWKSLGMAKMIDGWVLPQINAADDDGNPVYFDYTKPEYQFDVEVWQNEAVPGQYKFVGAYVGETFKKVLADHWSGLADLNAETEPVEILVDATNPKYVEMATQYSGCTLNSKLTTNGNEQPIYIGSGNAQYFALLKEKYPNQSDDAIKQAIYDAGTGDVFENGVFTFNTPIYGYSESDCKYVYQPGQKAITKITIGAGGGSGDGGGTGGGDENNDLYPNCNYIGWCDWTDGWVIPAYNDEDGNPYKGEDFIIRTEVWQEKDKPGMFHFASPYTGFWFQSTGAPNANVNETPIIIDATDTEVLNGQKSQRETERVDFTPVYMAKQFSGMIFPKNDVQEDQTLHIQDGGSALMDMGYAVSQFGPAYKNVAKRIDNQIFIPVPTICWNDDPMVKDGQIISWGPQAQAQPQIIDLPLRALPETSWRALEGKCEWIDGWVMSGYANKDGSAVDALKFPGKCVLQENDLIANVFRMVNPYTDDEYQMKVQNQTPTDQANIVIDARDPNFVVVEPQYSGFNSTTQPYFVANLAGYAFSKGRTREMVDAFVAEQDEANREPSTFEDGRIVIQFPLWGKTRTTTVQNWKARQAVIINHEGLKVDHSGVKDIEAIDTDDFAPVQYFNLQGQRVINPQAGTIVIKRQGRKATKMLVR